jgi:uncharacterized protein YndB with AHSA1/START domain
MAKQDAFFLIADISGYTKFMAQAEIEHAKGILEGLFGSILPLIRAPMSISGMQGDAVFAYAIDCDAVSGQFLVDLAERIYCAFAAERDKMEINTSCTCNACANIAALELKIVLHHGACVFQEANGRQELAGRDVIAAFRLLKNEVKANTGLTAYALVTCDAVSKMPVDEIFHDANRYVEEIEHIGPVEYILIDMDDARNRRDADERIFVGHDDELMFEEWQQEIPASPDTIFTMCSRKDLRGAWLGATGIDVLKSNDGRFGTGTELHCHHGKSGFKLEIVDWRPGEYLSCRYKVGFGLTFLETMEMQEVDGGTLFRLRNEQVRTSNLLKRPLAAMINRKLATAYAQTKTERLDCLTDMAIEMERNAAAPKVGLADAVVSATG